MFHIFRYWCAELDRSATAVSHQGFINPFILHDLFCSFCSDTTAVRKPRVVRLNNAYLDNTSGSKPTSFNIVRWSLYCATCSIISACSVTKFNISLRLTLISLLNHKLLVCWNALEAFFGKRCHSINLNHWQLTATSNSFMFISFLTCISVISLLLPELLFMSMENKSRFWSDRRWIIQKGNHLLSLSILSYSLGL